MSHRTQITLTDQQYARLQSEVARTGLTMAELVRRALDEVYADVRRRLRGLRESAGVWADRDDIVDGATYVQEIRRGFADRPSEQPG